MGEKKRKRMYEALAYDDRERPIHILGESSGEARAQKKFITF